MWMVVVCWINHINSLKTCILKLLSTVYYNSIVVFIILYVYFNAGLGEKVILRCTDYTTTGRQLQFDVSEFRRNRLHIKFYITAELNMSITVFIIPFSVDNYSSNIFQHPSPILFFSSAVHFSAIRLNRLYWEVRENVKIRQLFYI